MSAAVFIVLVLSGQAAAALPSSMAALGDSLTRGYGATGTTADAPAESWTTGTDATAASHYLRLAARNGAMSGHATNWAISGSKMADTYAQAASAVSQGADYVTILAGTNDVCAPTVSGMTSISDFTMQLRATLTRLTTGLTRARILVGSIPDWSGLWQTYQSNSAARSAWTTYRRCPDLLGAQATSTDRASVAQRIDDLDSATASICAGFAACTYDGGAVHGLRFAASELAFDYFHLSATGQARLASALWSAGPYAKPAPLTGFAATGGYHAITLSWPSPQGVKRLLILQKAGSDPTSPTDGTVAYDGDGSSGGAIVSGLTPGVLYGYSVWTYDIDGAQSDPRSSDATPTDSAPASTGLPVISGSPANGQTLTTTTGGWSGAPTGYAYQWRDCDSTGVACTDIVGASGASYQLTTADVGETIRVQVTATNGGGSTSAVSNPTAIVTAAPVAPNLAPDPNQEADPSSSYYTNGNANFSWTTDASHSPNHALKIVSTATTLSRWMTQTTQIPISPGTTYTISAWFKTSNASDAHLSASYWTGALSYQGTTVDSAQLVSGTQDWTQLSLQTTAPTGAAYLRIEFRLSGPGTVWIDDISAMRTG